MKFAEQKKSGFRKYFLCNLKTKYGMLYFPSWPTRNFFITIIQFITFFLSIQSENFK